VVLRDDAVSDDGAADVIVIGGGIVGLATAFRLGELHPERSVVILEKESALARHQTGHNSGVLHSGVYYAPGSLKARTCRAGKQALERFCQAEGIAFEICGKVIVATSEEERPRLRAIQERGRENGVRCELLDRARLGELEPHAAGVEALHVPEAGIVDYGQVAERLAARIRQRGGRIVTEARVTGFEERERCTLVRSTAGEFEARAVVNAAGLQSDRVTKLSGTRPSVKIIPFRGEYYDLVPEAAHVCRNLIYPVPDPSFPFLGVHFTRRISGGVECGPNAVLAFAREGYEKTTLRPSELLESLTYPGFLRLAARHFHAGMGELWRSLNKNAFVRALQRLVPEVHAEHLLIAPAGVRAQAIGRDGRMVDDFVVQRAGRIVNVVNAPSPAATACLEIGRVIVDLLDG
jgi:L-2-hydroxyglutarate oxidase